MRAEIAIKNDLSDGLSGLFRAKLNADEAIGRAKAILELIDTELAERSWIAAERATIADVALYSYIVAALEGNVDLSPYANVRAWLGRIEALPGFVRFPKTAAGLNAAA